MRKIYRSEATRTGVLWSGRQYRSGDAFAAGDDVNRLLSAGHSCLYGICHAAIVGIGASPGLGFVHTGSAMSFVLDIADLYKAEFTIPLAFDLAAGNHVEERDMRLALRDKMADGRLLHRIVDDIRVLLADGDGGDETGDGDRQELWDEKVGSVPGGVSWHGPGADDLMVEVAHQVVSGPRTES